MQSSVVLDIQQAVDIIIIVQQMFLMPFSFRNTCYSKYDLQTAAHWGTVYKVPKLLNQRLRFTLNVSYAY